MFAPAVAAAKQTDAPAARPVQAAQSRPPAIIGNQALLRSIQPKLTVGAADHPLEHEADRVADQVMRMPAPPITAAPPRISRKCDACAKDEEKTVRPKPVAPAASEAAAPAQVESALAAPGRPLDPAARAFFEPRFARDFSRVRVHADAAAAASAQAIGARAYAAGADIVFAAREYAPGTEAGRRLLAHELAHVAQQDAGPGVVRRDLLTPPPDPPPAKQPDLTDAQIRDALLFNRVNYDAANVKIIQTYLGGPVTGQLTADNIKEIASTQEEYGLKKDGKIGPDTFRFITGEQTAEGAGTDTPNCLTAFKAGTFPVVQTATPGPGGTTTITGHHVVEAMFSSRCNCGEFQYRQFISGSATAFRGGANEDLADSFPFIPGGRLPVLAREDGNTTWPSPNYGHRDQAGSVSTNAIPENRYFNDDGTTNQATGCRYKAEDFPKIIVSRLQTGDEVDITIQFRGEIQRNGRPIETKTWTDIAATVVTP
jgi:hypothetical protein